MNFPIGSLVTGTRDGETVTGPIIELCPYLPKDCAIVEVSGERTHIDLGNLTWAKTTEKENSVSEQEFIGARPADQGPKYQTPFQLDPVDESRIVDGQGHHVAEVDLDHRYNPGDDQKMAETIASALNDKFEARPETPTFVPRVLFAKERDGEGEGAIDWSTSYPFAYEVWPGQFWWASSREAAVREVRDSSADFKGWAPGVRNRLYDVRDPFGAPVTE